MNPGGLLAVFGLAVLSFVAVPYATESVHADRCVDEGGSYNYLDSACDHSKNHQYSSYPHRHPIAASVAVLGLGLAVSGTFIALRSKQQAD